MKKRKGENPCLTWRHSFVEFMTQKEAADLVGVRAATWIAWEKGYSIPHKSNDPELKRITDGDVSRVKLLKFSNL